MDDVGCFFLFLIISVILISGHGENLIGLLRMVIEDVLGEEISVLDSII